MRLLKSDNPPLKSINSLLFRLQVSVELRLSQCQAPFLALPHQSYYRKEKDDTNHSPDYPRILYPNLYTQRNRVEADREAEQVATKI
jgi:hypothetical protein